MTIKREGVPIWINGKEYYFTPLSPDVYFDICSCCLTPATGPAEYASQVIKGCVKLVHTALSYNHPEITLEEIANILHFGEGQAKRQSTKVNRVRSNGGRKKAA